MMTFKLGIQLPMFSYDDRVKFVSECFCMGESLQNIECYCISKFVLIQHILSAQVRDTGPMVLWFQFMGTMAREFERITFIPLTSLIP